MACAAMAAQCAMRQLSSARASCSSSTAASNRRQPSRCSSLRRSTSGCSVSRQCSPGRQAAQACAATPSSRQDLAEGALKGTEDGDEEEEVLTKEEDWVVPGRANDSLSSNTELGRAVQDACKELETLGGLERETIEKANALLQKLGYRVVEKEADGEPVQE